MNNTKSQTFPTLTQLSDYAFSWKVLDLNNILLDIQKLKPREIKSVYKIFYTWLDITIQIMLSDMPEENKWDKMIEVATIWHQKLFIHSIESILCFLSKEDFIKSNYKNYRFKTPLSLISNYLCKKIVFLICFNNKSNKSHHES